MWLTLSWLNDNNNNKKAFLKKVNKRKIKCYANPAHIIRHWQMCRLLMPWLTKLVYFTWQSGLRPGLMRKSCNWHTVWKHSPTLDTNTEVQVSSNCGRKSVTNFSLHELWCVDAGVAACPAEWHFSIYLQHLARKQWALGSYMWFPYRNGIFHNVFSSYIYTDGLTPRLILSPKCTHIDFTL